MSNGWTPERRARQAALIRSWKPWERSSGPRTAEGKAKAASNAWKGGNWLMLRELRRLVTAEVREARDLVEWVCPVGRPTASTAKTKKPAQ